jgi:serine/threonine-protein kinase
MDQESDRLLSVAGDVVEGAAISWDDETHVATDEETAATLRGLRELAVIIAAQRIIQRDYDATESRGTSPHIEVIPPSSRWRHLLILDKIGEGSFGAVYRAYDDKLKLDVALKLIAAAEPERSESPDRVLSEAQLLARVRQHNVVTVYGVDKTEDYVGVWMEFIKGRTLAELLKTQGPFSAQEAALIGRDLCRAIAAVHHAGVLHGDIKAHNVMREESGRTVLMDFGAGRRLIEHSADATRNVAGTPLYLAPEVLDRRAPTTSSDIYSLGVLLYHLVTGSYPVRGNSLSEIVDAHKRGERHQLHKERPDLPDGFVRVIAKATAVDPADRFARADTFEAALVNVMSGGFNKKPELRFFLVPRWVMVLVALVVLVGGGATVLWRAGTVKPAPESPGSAASVQASAPTPTVAVPEAASYEIDAGFYRANRNGEERLTPGGRLTPGDELFLRFQATVPINLFVVNEDEEGGLILEFPLPGQANPIKAGQPLTLPSTTTRWQVTSVGGREHFLVFASPDRLESLEQAFAQLPSPKENVPVVTRPLPPESIERLRAVGGLMSVGGLTPDPSKRAGARLSRLFTIPLTNASERVRGLWVRQITFDNPPQ